MKFKDYMVKKTSRINESSSYTKINEADASGFMETIKSAIAYVKAEGILPKYEEAAMQADAEINKAKIGGKLFQVQQKIEVLEKKKAATKDRAGKEKLVMQIDKLKAAGQNLELSAEAQQNALTDKFTNIKTEMDKEVSLIKGGLQDIIKTRMTSATQKAKQAGLEAKRKNLEQAGDKERAEAVKTELLELNKKAEETLKRIESGESENEDDLAEVEGIDQVKDQLMNYLAVSKGMNAINKKLSTLNASAEDLNPTLSDSFDVDMFITSLTEEDLFEEEGKGAPTPDDVRGKIMAAPKDDAEKKLELMKQLQGLIGEWTTQVEKQAEAKMAIWAKVKAPNVSTKSVIAVAGGDVESATEKDGGWVCDKLIPKWEAIENESPDSPLVKIKDVEAKIKDENIPQLEKDKEEVADETPAAKETPADETPADETPADDEALAAAKEELAKAEKELADAESDENVGPDEIEARQEKVEAAKKKKQELESTPESVKSDKPAESSPKKIMKFEDFMSSRSNG